MYGPKDPRAMKGELEVGADTTIKIQMIYRSLRLEKQNRTWKLKRVRSRGGKEGIRGER